MPGSETFVIKVNDFIFNTTPEDLEAADIISKSATEFNLIFNQRPVTGKVHECDMSGKKLRVEVEGEIFDVEIKDRLDQMLEKMALTTGGLNLIQHIKAPMPGLVLQVAVKEGQDVKKGEPVLILEAMKMENSIMLQSDAKIKKIYVNDGESVDKGQVLIELE